jgi:uncharacterized protein (DUF1778 family)
MGDDKDSKLTVRVTAAELKMLEAVAAAEGLNSSDVVRQYIHRAHRALREGSRRRIGEADRKWVVLAAGENRESPFLSRHGSAFSAACRALSQAADERENFFAQYIGGKPHLGKPVALQAHPGDKPGAKARLFRQGTDEPIDVEGLSQERDS